MRQKEQFFLNSGFTFDHGDDTVQNKGVNSHRP